MSSQFKFNLLTGSDAQTKYNNITTKDQYTIYLLQDAGIGYLGNKKLFDNSLLVNMASTLNPDATDNVSTVPTSKAVIDYVDAAVADKVSYEFDGTAGTSSSSDNNSSSSSQFSIDMDYETLVNNSISDNTAMCTQIGKWMNGKPIYRYKQNYMFSKNNPTRTWNWTTNLPSSLQANAAHEYVLSNHSVCLFNKDNAGWIPVSDLDDFSIKILGNTITMTTTNADTYNNISFFVIFDFVDM